MRKHWLIAVVTVPVALAAVVGAGVGAAAPKAKGSIIVFMPPGTDNYLAEWQKGAREQAKKLGYDIKIVENKFDQAEEDTQVQQQLASGKKPSAYIWWPVDNKAGSASLRALGTSGVPTFMTNQYPLKGTEGWWVAYSGVDDFLNGTTSGQLLRRARGAALAKGMKLHSKGGNTLIISFPAGYSAGDDRITAFTKATANLELKVLAKQNAGFGETEGYKIGSQMVAANKSKGIDFVYATNDALASGMIQALREAGMTPGKDVTVIGGTCHGNLADLLSGREYGTGLQAARLEGQYSVIVANRYLTNGKKVTNGKNYAPPTPTRAPGATGAVYRYNFIPNPPVLHGAKSINGTKLWGYSMRQLCTY